MKKTILIVAFCSMPLLSQSIFKKIIINSQNIMSKNDKQRFNTEIKFSALDINAEWKVYTTQDRVSIYKENGVSKYFKYFNKIYPTIKNVDKNFFKCIYLDSDYKNRILRGAD